MNGELPLLTASRLRARRKCSRYERLRYVEGWRPLKDAGTLLFGTLWHVGMEAWWKAPPTEGALTAALAAVAGKASGPFAQVRCEEMLRGYHARWSPSTYDVLGVEEQFRAPHLNPATMAASRTWMLGGKVDVRIRDESGAVVVVEHKSTSEDIAPTADYWLKLQMDHQLSIYVIGAETLGDSPQGCLYDVAKKPGQKPLKATPEADRKYTKPTKKDPESRLYAGQREADETPEEYRARVRTAIESDLSAYFQRRTVPRIESQIADFMHDAWTQGQSMRADHVAGRAPRNPDSCHQYGTCAFWICCSTGSSPEDHGDLFRRSDNPNPELETEAA